MISFVIPAHNEELCLPKTLAALQSAADEVGQAYEIIVVSDSSSDGTSDIAIRFGVRLIEVTLQHISATRNAGARQAHGDYFFFVDADTQVNANAIRDAIEAMARGAVGGACHFQYDGSIPIWARLMLPLGNCVGRIFAWAGGAFFFCQRMDFEAVGGFSEEVFAAEDLALIQTLKSRGRFVILKPKVLTSNRKIESMSLARGLAILFRILVRGPKSYSSRAGLELWYDSNARSMPRKG